MKAVVISALSSGQGKTLFTMALLHWLKENFGAVRPFKVGPDYIDPRFHEKITGVDSVNLDLYMMSEDDVKNAFAYYSQDAVCSVIEGVMGFYDGIDYGSSTYEVAKTINVPTILLVSAGGSYSTLVPALKGIIDYKPDNTIKGVVLNMVSSAKHFELIKKQIESEIPNVKVLGWIKKGLEVISSRHLGLDLTELDNAKLDEISQNVMENINTPELLDFMELKLPANGNNNSFMGELEDIKAVCGKLKIALINDRAFSFVYKQNIDFLDRYFAEVVRVSALNNEEIPSDVDLVYIPGGYIETPDVAEILDKANNFKQSLKKIADDPNKKIYAECAGLMFLGEKIQTTDDKWISGAGILPMNFEIQKRWHRLGYYKAIDKDDLTIYKGHAFHYSCPVDIKDSANVQWGLFKDRDSKASVGAWSNKNKNVIGTYLHAFFYNQPELVLRHLIGEKND